MPGYRVFDDLVIADPATPPPTGFTSASIGGASRPRGLPASRFRFGQAAIASPMLIF
jgi:hypothetical protein